MTFLGRAERTKAEAGFALVTVMLSMMALLGLSIAIVEYGIGSQILSKRDENWNAALAAAQAGVADYLHRVNSQSNYATLYGTSSGQTPDSTNSAMSGFRAVPGSRRRSSATGSTVRRTRSPSRRADRRA